MKVNLKSNMIKKQALVVIILSLVLGLLFQNCSQLGSSDVTSNSSSKASSSEQELLMQKAMFVMQTNCAACHNNEIKTNGVNVTNLDEMLSVGVIIVNEPILSPLMQVLQNPTILEHGLLKQKDINTLTKWIAEGFKDTTDGGTAGGEIIPLGPTWKSINQNIVSRRCTGCHNSVNLSGGISFQTYAGVSSRIAPGMPNQSLFFQRIAGLPRANGTVGAIMPLGGLPLNAQEQMAISLWITAGAMND